MEKNRFTISSRVLAGIFLVAIGGFMLLMKLGYVEDISIWRYFPVILILAGIIKIIQAQSGDEQRSGAWLTFVGVWMLVSFTRMFDLTFSDTWPALIVGIGIGMIWKSLTSETTRNRNIETAEVTHG